MTDVMTDFGPDFDNRVPGEVILKLASRTEREVTESVPTGPARLLVEALPNRLGLTALDKVLAKLKTRGLARVHKPVSPRIMALGGLAEVASELTGTYRVILGAGVDPDEAAQELASVPGVATAEPNRFRFATIVPNDPMYANQWGLAKINCPAAWDRTTGSSGVLVAVVDTGIDIDHPDLAPLIGPGQDLVDLAGVSPPSGYRFEGDFLTRDADALDEVGHGTHVAGTIAALSNNGVGVAGVTWQCRLMPVRVLARLVRISDGRVTGSGTAVDIAAGIRWAADHGAVVMNMSLGGYSDTMVERDAVAYAIGRGCVVVAAMGNDDTTTPSYPAAYPDVIAVGAIQSNESRAFFSNRGPHIDVAAPGVGIRSTIWDNGYGDLSGTSMASPHVAGVAALIRSCNPTLTAAEVGQIIRDTARALRDNPADPVPNDSYGSGLVDAKAALDRACPKLKIADDPTLKFSDDPTLKSADDPTLKTADDPTINKNLDDPTLKTADDPTLKFSDDPTLKSSDDPTLKTADDPTINKNLDDPTLKTADDPTLKVFDDPTLKVRDDPTLKANDDVTANKALDDPTLKTRDDPTFKNLDDPTLKSADDTTLNKTADDPTLKNSDDVTAKFFDDFVTNKVLDDGQQTSPAADRGPPYTPPGGEPRPAPFVLSTPHHTNQWAQTFPEAHQQALAELTRRLQQCEATLAEYHQAAQQGQLTQEEQGRLQAMHQEYEAMIAEYRQMTGT